MSAVAEWDYFFQEREQQLELLNGNGSKSSFCELRSKYPGELGSQSVGNQPMSIAVSLVKV